MWNRRAFLRLGGAIPAAPLRSRAPAWIASSRLRPPRATDRLKTSRQTNSTGGKFRKRSRWIANSRSSSAIWSAIRRSSFRTAKGSHMRAGHVRSFSWSVAIATALWTLGAPCAWAQGSLGGLRGAVRDANGVVPGAQVALTNQGTNISRNTVTNDVGEYTFPAVTPGVYTVTAALQGFRTFERSGLTIATQQFITLDITLEVGAIRE